MHKKRAFAITSAVAIGVGGFTWWNLTRVSLANNPNAFMIKTMVPVYQSLEFMPMNDLHSVQNAIKKSQILGPIPVPGTQGIFNLPLTQRLKQQNDTIYNAQITQDQIDALQEQTAELIYFRLLNDDPVAYIESRKARGAESHCESALIERGWGSNNVLFPYYVGRDPVPNDTMNTLIAETFTRWKEDTEVRGLKAIAAPGKGLICSIGMIDTTHDISTQLLSTELGIDGWSGSAPATGGTFLFPLKTPKQLLASYGALPYARVGTVFDYSNTVPQAVVFEFIWNPDINDWHFTSALFVNRKDQDARTLPHF
tara:strand:- start:2098 stop:3033 length:936 start_codon:yes stop_codon:yes gene_type:complete